MSIVTFHNGETVEVANECIIGRGRPVCWNDAEISREQVQLSRVEGCPDVLLLENKGLNPVMVEVSPAGRTEGPWELKDFLERGMSTLVEAGSRFYILSKQDTTLAHIQPHPSAQGDRTLVQHAAASTEVLAPLGCGTDVLEDLISSDDDAMPEEPGGRGAKRRRVEGGGVSGNVPPRESPFSLMWVRGLSADHNSGCYGARLRQLVQGSMKFALVENYMIDLGWLLMCCPDLAAAEQVVVVHGEHGEREQGIKDTIQQRGLQGFTTHRPPLPIAYGTHHSKAFLLQYEDGIRLIIHTANLIYPDCNHKTQGLWCQDFPQKTPGCTTSQFERDLSEYLSALKLRARTWRAVADILAAHDFSCARAQLVASVPGYHSGRRVNAFGHMRVRALLQQVVLPAVFRDCQLLCQCSSLGSLDEKWLLDEFGGSLAAGRFEAADRGQTAGQAGQAVSMPVSAPRLSPSRLGLVWPEVQEVRNSMEGWVAGYSIPGPQKNVGKPFLRPYLRRYEGTPAGRQRAMPHIKTYCRYQGQQLAWFLVGSHNLSKAAWGALQKGGTQLMVRSYELGVLLVPQYEAAYRSSPQWQFTCGGARTPAATSSTPCPTASPPSDAVPATDIAPVPGPPAPVQFWASTRNSNQLASTHPTDPSAAVSSDAAAGSRLDSVKSDVQSDVPGNAQSDVHNSGQSIDGDGGEGGLQQPLICHLPLPYPLPPAPYRDGDQPWMCDVEYPGLDALGRPWGAPARYYGRVEPPDTL